MIVEGNQKELDATERFHKGNRQEGFGGGYERRMFNLQCTP